MGLRLEVPDSFVLFPSQNGEVQRKGRVVWRLKADIAVKFVRSERNAQEVTSYISDTLSRVAPATSDED